VSAHWKNEWGDLDNCFISIQYKQYVAQLYPGNLNKLTRTATVKTEKVIQVKENSLSEKYNEERMLFCGGWWTKDKIWKKLKTQFTRF
jgi:hypothetical protein